MTENNNDEWWEIYNKYLHSKQWRAKRQLVLDRDVFCQQCLKHPATEVHHISYESVFNESLWHLVGICKQCHVETTLDSRKRRVTSRINIARKWRDL